MKEEGWLWLFCTCLAGYRYKTLETLFYLMPIYLTAFSFFKLYIYIYIILLVLVNLTIIRFLVGGIDR